VRHTREAGWCGRAAAKTEHRQRAITRGISSLQGMSERGLHQPAGSSCFVCSISMSHLRCWCCTMQQDPHVAGCHFGSVGSG